MSKILKNDIIANVNQQSHLHAKGKEDCLLPNYLREHLRSLLRSFFSEPIYCIYLIQINIYNYFEILFSLQGSELDHLLSASTKYSLDGTDCPDFVKWCITPVAALLNWSSVLP